MRFNMYCAGFFSLSLCPRKRKIDIYCYKLSCLKYIIQYLEFSMCYNWIFFPPRVYSAIPFSKIWTTGQPKLLSQAAQGKQTLVALEEDPSDWAFTDHHDDCCSPLNVNNVDSMHMAHNFPKTKHYINNLQWLFKQAW